MWHAYFSTSAKFGGGGTPNTKEHGYLEFARPILLMVSNPLEQGVTRVLAIPAMLFAASDVPQRRASRSTNWAHRLNRPKRW